MGYPRLIYLLEQCLSQGDNQITRDCQELSYIQSGKFLPNRFADKLIEISSEKILDKATHILSRSGIIVNGEIIKENTNGEYAVFNILPETNNLLRSLPFVTTSAFTGFLDDNLAVKEISSAAVSSPLTRQLFWAEIDPKACESNNRITTSKVQDFSLATGINKNNKASLNLDSLNLEICYLASGKLDFLISDFDNHLEFAAAEFIAKKAGAVSFVDHKNKTVKIASNKEIFEKL